MEYREHCLHCRKRFGEDFDYVHRWLDEFYGSDQFGTPASRRDSQATPGNPDVSA